VKLTGKYEMNKLLLILAALVTFAGSASAQSYAERVAQCNYGRGITNPSSVPYHNSCAFKIKIDIEMAEFNLPTFQWYEVESSKQKATRLAVKAARKEMNYFLSDQAHSAKVARVEAALYSSNPYIAAKAWQAQADCSAEYQIYADACK
jgi:hypothetical protein